MTRPVLFIRPVLLLLATAAITGCRIDLDIAGEGTVTSESGSFNCDHGGGPDCTQTYASGASERFFATPAPGYTFASWQNCVFEDLLSCTITFNDDGAATPFAVPVRATFTKLRPEVTPATYTYNAFGQRVTKTVGGKTTIFQYDLQGSLIAEIDAATGKPLREHVHIGREPVAQLTTNPANGLVSTQYIHADHLGTPTLLTDDAGNVVADIEATPFGETYVDYAAVEHNRRFPGQYKDAESGLHYNYFRDYDPSLGRYIQSDPIGLWGGLNTYAYVEGNPLMYIDPFGLLGGQMNRHHGRPDHNPQNGGTAGVWGCMSGACVKTPLPGQPGDVSGSLATILVGGGLYICSKPPDVDCDEDGDNISDELDNDGIPDTAGISTIWFGVTISQNDQFCIYLGPSFGSPIAGGEGVRTR